MNFDKPPLPAGANKLLFPLALYLQDLLRFKNDPNAPKPIPPKELDLKLQTECELIADVTFAAFRNPKQVKWSLSEYTKASKGGKKLVAADREKALRDKMPGISSTKPDGNLEITDEPFCVRDAKEVVLAWYLPGVISVDRQDEISYAIEWLSTAPDPPALVIDPDTNQKNFRAHPSLFSESQSGTFRSGVATYASAWPMQGHLDGPFDPSASFKNPKQGGLDFIKLMSESLAVLGGILALVHPALFQAGLDALANLGSGHIDNVENRKLLKSVLRHWSTPFTAISVIVNRESPFHTDAGSHPSSYDLLYAGGSYRGGVLEIKGIDVRVMYEPGTVVLFPAGIFPHGVPSVHGDRFCIAHFFRHSVLEQVPYFRPPALPKFVHLSDIYFNGFADVSSK